MTLTNEQIAHGIKLLDRLIQSNNEVMKVLSTLDNKQVERNIKDNDTYQYLLFHLKTLVSNE
jgi:hypothetical protein